MKSIINTLFIPMLVVLYSLLALSFFGFSTPNPQSNTIEWLSPHEAKERFLLFHDSFTLLAEEYADYAQEKYNDPGYGRYDIDVAFGVEDTFLSNEGVHQISHIMESFMIQDACTAVGIDMLHEYVRIKFYINVKMEDSIGSMYLVYCKPWPWIDNYQQIDVVHESMCNGHYWFGSYDYTGIQNWYTVTYYEDDEGKYQKICWEDL